MPLWWFHRLDRHICHDDANTDIIQTVHTNNISDLTYIVIVMIKGIVYLVIWFVLNIVFVNSSFLLSLAFRYTYNLEVSSCALTL